MSVAHRVRIKNVRVLSDDWSVLKRTIFAFERADGIWQEQRRETYDRGNGATLLPYNLGRGTVVLIRQFRYPAFVNGHDDLLIETPAGLLDDAAPEARIRVEVEEETGLRLRDVTRLWDVFMSPGSVTERVHFFIAAYDTTDRVGPGGGNRSEGEDIEVMEVSIAHALAMIASGTIRDAKTIMLLQYAALHVFGGNVRVTPGSAITPP